VTDSREYRPGAGLHPSLYRSPRSVFHEARLTITAVRINDEGTAAGETVTLSPGHDRLATAARCHTVEPWGSVQVYPLWLWLRSWYRAVLLAGFAHSFVTSLISSTRCSIQWLTTGAPGLPHLTLF